MNFYFNKNNRHDGDLILYSSCTVLYTVFHLRAYNIVVPA